ncbi:hypothetical protein CFD26_106368 [Aspergillus turcosus]|uniref:Major facilitator superfamily (MFS) profile domain-containing protein n=1 Tax=Aspergillus turcosus TaxID=1245748 RepID=A0A421D6H8_9EURO|nr:hypothetical protein CFD26_106368 [Aspergillus turcosus]
MSAMDTGTNKENIQFSHVEEASPSMLSQAHQQFLLERHGTINLEPIPSMSPNDPLNWPQWKKLAQMFLVVLHAFMNTFAAASLISAFAVIAKEYGVSIHKATYLVAVQILFLGLFPLLWNPLAERFGRQPIYLLSTFMMCVFNIAGGFCKSYGAQMATRVLFAIFACPPLGFGSAVVTELFFTHERAQKMGWWTLMITLGIPLGPIVFGFVVEHAGLPLLFWTLAAANAVQFLAYLALRAETLYDSRDELDPAIAAQRPSAVSSRNALTISEFLRPLTLFARPRVLLPAVSYGFFFTYANTAITVELPILFEEKLHFNTQQVGLQYLSVLVGAGLGEQVSGPLSDMFLTKYTKKTGRHCPEHRLWIAYIGFITSIAGIMVWGVQLDKMEHEWNITPLVGAAISNFGSQIVGTTLITYAVDCHEDLSAHIGIFVNIIRQTWAFIGPFYFPSMYESLGLIGGSGLLVGLLVVVAVAPIVVIHIRGERSRGGLNR